MAKPIAGEQPRQAPVWLQRWRRFWALRSGARTKAALALALLALLAVVYLALPATAQQTVTQTLMAVAQSLGAAGLRLALECALILCLLGVVALLFAAPAATVGRVSVYLDAENVNEQRLIQTIVSRLRSEYAGKPLDLLYFAQLNDVNRGGAYRTLNLLGFQAVHVPSDPTGTGNKIREAADKELALHALQRALLGPARQKFILISKDGGYVPLVYRLTALGHTVEVWSPDPIKAYLITQSFLHIKVVDLAKLAHAVSEGGGEPTAAERPGKRRPKPAAKEKKPSAAADAAAASLALPDPPSAPFAYEGERQLYAAIYQTCELCMALKPGKGADAPSWRRLRDTVRTRMTPTLVALGYSSYTGIAYWIRRLSAIGALSQDEESAPTVGLVAASLAAQRLFAMTLASARAATQAKSNRSDGALNMQVICAALVAQAAQGASNADLEPLRTLLAPTSAYRFAHVSFFVSSARALGLLDYSNPQKSPDLIQAPRLTPLADRIIAEQAQPLTTPTPEQA